MTSTKGMRVGVNAERSLALITRSVHQLANQYGNKMRDAFLQYVCSVCEGTCQRLPRRNVIAKPIAKCAKKAFSQVLIPDSTHLHPPQRSHKTTSLAFASCTFQLRSCLARDKNLRSVLRQQVHSMGGPALLPTAVPPPRNKQKFPWQVAIVPVPKPARNVARRPGVHPFADMAAGFGDLISSISRGETGCSRLHRLRSAACTPVLTLSVVAGPKFDIVLSSGFLAFASHSGFLKAVEEARISAGCFCIRKQHCSLCKYSQLTNG